LRFLRFKSTLFVDVLRKPVGDLLWHNHATKMRDVLRKPMGDSLWHNHAIEIKNVVLSLIDVGSGFSLPA
jgi:hypothetical protein